MGRDPSRGRSRRKAGMKPELRGRGREASGPGCHGPWALVVRARMEPQAKAGLTHRVQRRQGSLIESRDREEGGLPRPGA